jgi:stringent starvation protein B
MNMKPKRPYLLRAFYEWIVDNGMTPHILVDARSNQVSVPRQFVKDGNIVLNVSMTAANNLMMRDDEVTFNARFGGKAFSIYLPMWSIMAIYSRETQDGISFPPDEYENTPVGLEDQLQEDVALKTGPVLAAIDGSNMLTEEEQGIAEPIVVELEEEQEPPPEPPKPSSPPRRPALRVVK